MPRETNAAITFDDAHYMVANEGYEQIEPSMPTGNECMTRAAIEWFLEVYPDPLQGYEANQLVVYQDVQLPQISTSGVNWIVGGQKDASGNNISVSANGTEWTLASISFLSIVNQVKFLQGKWYAVGFPTTSGGADLAVSDDGISWTAINTGVLDSRCIDYGGGKYVIGGGRLSNTYNAFGYSSDGINWTTVLKTDISINTIKYDGVGKWLAGGEVDLVSNPDLYTSTNGINWSGVSHPLSSILSIGYSGNQWLLGSSIFNSSYPMATSSDGTNWTGQHPTSLGLDGDDYVKGIQWYNSQWVISIRTPDKHEIATSPNGSTWTGRGQNFSSLTEDVQGAENKILSVSDNGAIYSSELGSTWSYEGGCGLSPAYDISVRPYNPDTTAPVFSTSVSASNITINSITFSWQSTDNVGVTSQVGYIRVNSGGWTSISLQSDSTTYNKSGMNPGDSCEFYVIAQDAESNSTKSNTVSTSTEDVNTTEATIFGDTGGNGYSTKEESEVSVGSSNAVYYEGSSLERLTRLYANSTATTYFDGTTSDGTTAGWFNWGDWLLQIDGNGIVMEKQNTNDTLSISPTSRNMTSSGGTYTVTITCNTGWVIQSLPSWASVSATSGTGNGSVTITVASNGGTDTPDRDDNIIFETDSRYTRVDHNLSQDGTYEEPETWYHVFAYSGSTASEACSQSTSVLGLEMNHPDFQQATKLRTNFNGKQNPAPANYYSSDFYVRYWSGSFLQAGNTCGGIG